jgi:outer membrane protein assembly factor BamB
MTWQQSPTVDVAASGVVVATGGRLGAPTPGLDADTGDLRWQIDLPEKYLGASETLVFTVRVDAEPRNTLNAFDRRTGRKRWSFPVAAETGHTMFDVVAGNRSTVVVASGPYTVRSGPDPIAPTTFLVLDADSGRERTRFLSADPAIPFSDFAIVDGALVYAENGDALARDLATGRVRWRRHATFPRPLDNGGLPWMRLQLSADHRTVFTSGERGIAEVLDARTGAVLWNAKDGFLQAAAGDDAVFEDGEQRIASVVARTGKPRWQRELLGALRRRGFVPTNVGVDDGLVVLSATCDDG